VSLISEAGVAGEPRGILFLAAFSFCPDMYGDLTAGFGVGIGGGAISDRCSGDIDPFSDWSVLGAEFDEATSLACDG